MGRKALAALLPVGCAFILLGVLNHVKLHLNVDHFAIIMGVLALLCIAVGAWAALGELRGAPAGISSSAASVAAAPVAAVPAAEEAPVPASVAAGSDDPTIQA